MLWQLYYNLIRPHRKLRHFRLGIRDTDNNIWRQEFLKHQLWEVRGNMREQYDWLRERVEGAIRRKAETIYDIYYAETGDVVKVTDLPLPPREIEQLPDKPTEPHRFYKVKKKDYDKKVVEELDRIIELREPDLAKQKENLEKIDTQVKTIDAQIGGLHELKASLFSMYRKL